MNREEQTIEASRNYLVKSGYIKIDDVSLRTGAKLFFIEGAKWADKTILQEVLEWLEVHFSDVHVLHDDRLEGNFGSKEQMLQSFKERFNISE